MKRITIIIASLFLVVGVAQTQEGASTMDELLQQIERGQARDSQEARQREQRFAQARNEQQNLLNQSVYCRRYPAMPRAVSASR